MKKLIGGLFLAIPLLAQNNIAGEAIQRGYQLQQDAEYQNALIEIERQKLALLRLHIAAEHPGIQLVEVTDGSLDSNANNWFNTYWRFNAQLPKAPLDSKNTLTWLHDQLVLAYKAGANDLV